MLNYLTFWVSESALAATVYVLRFLYCGKVVRNITVTTENKCSCKLTFPIWIGCNDLKEVDSVVLIADNVTASNTPVIIQQ